MSVQMEEIIDKYADMVYRIALIHMRNDKESADDIFQDVFFVLVKKKMRFNDDEHCKAWLINVTLTMCKKYHFKRKDIVLDEQDVNKMREEKDASDIDERSNRIYECVCKLPEKYKSVIDLFYFEDFSTKEIAKILRMSEATVRKRLSRAREYLKDDMEELL